jgi:hypothetical protein
MDQRSLMVAALRATGHPGRRAVGGIWEPSNGHRQPTPRISSGDRLGRERQVHHQELEVGPTAQRVELRLGTEPVASTEARGDRLTEKIHRAAGFERPVRGWNRRARQPGNARQPSVAAGSVNSLGGARIERVSVKRGRPIPISRGAGEVALGPAHLATTQQALGQVPALLDIAGLGPYQFLESRDGAIR